MTDLPIACTLSEPDLRARQQEIVERLFHGIEQIAELEDGFAFRFSGTDEWASALLEFIRFERRCCAFFLFELAFEPSQGPIWLRLRGGEAAKEFVRTSLMAGAFPT